jgi:hypothetical protein
MTREPDPIPFSVDDAESDSKTHSDPLIRATDWLNASLEPILGPPQTVPNDGQEPTPASERSCPVCGRRMDEHTVELVDGHTYYHHSGGYTSNVMEGSEQ